jgi:kumamolisin
MDLPHTYKPVTGTGHTHPDSHKALKPTADDTPVTVTLIVRRRPDGPKLPQAEEMTAHVRIGHKRLSHGEFAASYGADPKELEEVAHFAHSHKLEVVETHLARRSVVVRGPASAINKAFAVELHDFDSPRGRYHSHRGVAHLPASLAEHVVEAVIGLDNRKVPAQHFSTARRQNPADPSNTKSLTPQQVAKLYNFPAGDGTRETIGIYEMETGDGPAGYSMQDLTDTMRAFGGGLKLPPITDVSIDGVTNSGTSDGETGLDITVAGAIAQGAQIAVYFTGGEEQSILNAVQRMVHPDTGDPQPSILSISYGFGPDDGQPDGLSDASLTQLSSLFQDASQLALTVLVSSGDSGAFVASTTQAQTSYPGSDPFITACGGTTAGNIVGTTFDEFVWNDAGKGGPGATGGGVSARFPVPGYQQNVHVPVRNGTGKPGRGVPDIAGNASENSGYPQFISGEEQPVGGTSAVAPLYAGLTAIINANLGAPAGFLNPILYAPGAAICRDVTSPPGPADNSLNGVTGYPAGPGWDACTGFGSLDGTALEAAIKAAMQGAAPPTPAPVAASAHSAAAAPAAQHAVFETGTFRGVAKSDAFAAAASQTEPVIVNLGPVSWPAGLAPAPTQLGKYAPGQNITEALQAQADALIVLFTEPETQALLDVLTQNNAWTAARRKAWNGYGHNFAQFAPIANSAGDEALESGLFGYLNAMKIGNKTVVLFKSELHPKQNGSALPFVGVMQQLIQELQPKLVIGTGTAGAIGSHIQCGDVAITDRARFHCEVKYPPKYADIDTMSANHTELTNTATFDPKWVQYAAANFTKLSLSGLSQCYSKLQKLSGYSFVHKNQGAPSIYVTNVNPAPGPQPMDIVSADYLTVDDKSDAEGLQSSGIMNDTDDAFLFYAISKMTGTQPKWLSVRNASEPQIVVPPFAPGTSPSAVVNKLKGVAGSVYGIYQYCTTLNSAFACWGVVAGM